MHEFEDFLDSLNKIVSQEEFTDIVLKALFSSEATPDEIAQILSRYEVQALFDIDLLKKLIDNLISDYKLIPVVDTIVSLVIDIYDCIQDYIINFIVDLIVSDSWQRRVLGRKLFDKIKPTIEDANILGLNEELQIKFAVSLTQDYDNAEHRCIHLCQIFNSKSSEVRRSLLEIIVDYTLNYLGKFQMIIEDGNFYESEELEQYKYLLSVLNTRFDLSNKCTEFFSENFFPKIFEIAKRSEQEFLQEHMRKYETSQKSTYLQFFRPLTLGRGGGFRKNGHVTPLSKITNSAIAPMMLSSKTPLEQRKFLKILSEDWNIKMESDE